MWHSNGAGDSFATFAFPTRWPIRKQELVVTGSNTRVAILCLALGLVAISSPAVAAENVRARDLGIPFEGQTGILNAITDVAGVEVGQVTLVQGEGGLTVGEGPVRTGVTVVHPRGKTSTEGVFAGWFTLNASGEMTGTTWLEERGLVDGPISITNTHSVGVVRDAAVAWMVRQGWDAVWHAPVVAETYDGALNDINGFHVTRDHALTAMERAVAGPVAEGAVGGGTGMVCNGFKGGIGTASRRFEVNGETFTVGVLVQCNYNWDGLDLRLGGKRVDHLLPVGQHCFSNPAVQRHVDWYPYCDAAAANSVSRRGRDGSIIVVVATDAPLLPHQLMRVAKRPSLALGRLGAVSSDGSGDIFVAFSTANAGRLSESDFSEVGTYPNNDLTTVFTATVQATEEAIVNAMVAADTMIGASGFRVPEMPEDQVRLIFRKSRN
jgi:L-aminopeptidase/D-esterase-like protein